MQAYSSDLSGGCFSASGASQPSDAHNAKLEPPAHSPFCHLGGGLILSPPLEAVPVSLAPSPSGSRGRFRRLRNLKIKLVRLGTACPGWICKRSLGNGPRAVHRLPPVRPFLIFH